MNILVLGIGQSLRGDDSAGLEVIRLWQTIHPCSAARVQVELLELPGLTVLELLEHRDMSIIVDAVHTFSSSGKVMRLGLDEVARFTPESRSGHGWGVAETLHLGRLLFPGLKECRITLFGITSKKFGMGDGLSPEVGAAIITTTELVEREIQKYLD
jgi:hydrogenase maturation protease